MSRTLQSEVAAAVAADRKRALAIIAGGNRLGVAGEAIVEAILIGVSAEEFVRIQQTEALARRIAAA